jgi:hypothetical protein
MTIGMRNKGPSSSISSAGMSGPGPNRGDDAMLGEAVVTCLGLVDEMDVSGQVKKSVNCMIVAASGKEVCCVSLQYGIMMDSVYPPAPLVSSFFYFLFFISHRVN